MDSVLPLFDLTASDLAAQACGGDVISLLIPSVLRKNYDSAFELADRTLRQYRFDHLPLNRRMILPPLSIFPNSGSFTTHVSDYRHFRFSPIINNAIETRSLLQFEEHLTLDSIVLNSALQKNGKLVFSSVPLIHLDHLLFSRAKLGLFEGWVCILFVLLTCS